MAFSRFQLVSLARVILLGLSIFLFIFLVWQQRFYAAGFLVGLTIVFQVWSFQRLVNKSHQDLKQFLRLIQNSDFTSHVRSDSLGGQSGDVEQLMNQIQSEFQKLHLLAEERLHFLQRVVQHIGISLVVLRSDGTVEMTNPAMKKLLGPGAIRSIDTIAERNENLARTLREIGDRDKVTINFHAAAGLRKLVLNAACFEQQSGAFKLVTIRDATTELAEQEMEAWEKLVRVLTHEIMNSVTPIASLAGTVDEMFDEVDKATDPNEADNDIENMRSALKTIRRRSEGLLHFLKSYRSLTSIPTPSLQIIPVTELFERVEQLSRARIDTDRITLSSSIDPASLEITADLNLIEQVLINLINNALQSINESDTGSIHLAASLKDNGQVVIQVSDNGPGIPPDLLDKIFIPFFTTRANGNGIGLSLSRQIMRKHKGDLDVISNPNDQTVFSLNF